MRWSATRKTQCRRCCGSRMAWVQTSSLTPRAARIRCAPASTCCGRRTVLLVLAESRAIRRRERIPAVLQGSEHHRLTRPHGCRHPRLDRSRGPLGKSTYRVLSPTDRSRTPRKRSRRPRATRDASCASSSIRGPRKSPSASGQRRSGEVRESMEAIFIVNEEQRAILETVKRFVDEEVRPRAAKLDADPILPRAFRGRSSRRRTRLGIRTMTLSEKWGGLAANSLTDLHGDRGACER